MNATLDAVTEPLGVAAVYVARISKGDIPAPITEEYKGDFNEIKVSLNTCIDAVNSLSGGRPAGPAAVKRNLATRADAANTRVTSGRSCRA